MAVIIWRFVFGYLAEGAMENGCTDEQKPESKKPNLDDWAKCCLLWLPDLGSNQGPTD
jgi:hypothetical protein